MDKHRIIIIEQIRQNSRDTGYQARISGAYIPNPFPVDNPFHTHWNDGYDLGVQDANKELFPKEYESFLAEDFRD